MDEKVGWIHRVKAADADYVGRDEMAGVVARALRTKSGITFLIQSLGCISHALAALWGDRVFNDFPQILPLLVGHFSDPWIG
jgi:hypothetical protein